MAAAKNRSRIGMGCLTAFLSLFVIVFGGFGGWGVYQQFRVRGFAPVEGVVTHSVVGASRGDDGTTYYPDIRFRYTVDGKTYDSGEYRIQQISSSGRRGKARIVRQYPVGKKVPAWYDPGDPDTAVIDRSFSFFPVIFFAIGVVVLGVIVLIWVGHVRGWTWGHRSGGASGGMYGTGDAARGTEVRLKPFGNLAGQVHTFKGMLFFTVVWNGFIWTIAAFLWFSNEDSIPIFAKVVVGLFMAVGVGLAFSTIKMGLARMKLEAPEVTVSVQPLRVGEPFDVSFRQRAKGPVHVQHVTAKLICREFATYRRGTDTTTVTHDVHEQEAVVVQEVAASSIQPIQGSASLAIPADGMHSFHAARNRIVWLLEVQTAVDDWPDYRTTFELQVAPERVLSGVAV